MSEKITEAHEPKLISVPLGTACEVVPISSLLADGWEERQRSLTDELDARQRLHARLATENPDDQIYT